MKMTLGAKYKVCAGSGLDSFREGKLVQYPGESRLRKDEAGRYKYFSGKTEACLIDEKGKYFTMFENRLIPI